MTANDFIKKKAAEAAAEAMRKYKTQSGASETRSKIGCFNADRTKVHFPPEIKEYPVTVIGQPGPCSPVSEVSPGQFVAVGPMVNFTQVDSGKQSMAIYHVVGSVGPTRPSRMRLYIKKWDSKIAFEVPQLNKANSNEPFKVFDQTNGTGGIYSAALNRERTKLVLVRVLPVEEIEDTTTDISTTGSVDYNYKVRVSWSILKGVGFKVDPKIISSDPTTNHGTITYSSSKPEDVVEGETIYDSRDFPRGDINTFSHSPDSSNSGTVLGCNLNIAPGACVVDADFNSSSVGVGWVNEGHKFNFFGDIQITFDKNSNPRIDFGGVWNDFFNASWKIENNYSETYEGCSIAIVQCPAYSFSTSSITYEFRSGSNSGFFIFSDILSGSAAQISTESLTSIPSTSWGLSGLPTTGGSPFGVSPDIRITNNHGFRGEEGYNRFLYTPDSQYYSNSIQTSSFITGFGVVDAGGDNGKVVEVKPLPSVGNDIALPGNFTIDKTPFLVDDTGIYLFNQIDLPENDWVGEYIESTSTKRFIEYRDPRIEGETKYRMIQWKLEGTKLIKESEKAATGDFNSLYYDELGVPRDEISYPAPVQFVKDGAK